MTEELWSKEKQEAERFAQMMERYVKYEYIPLAKKIVGDIPDKTRKVKIADIASGPGFLSIELTKNIQNAKITAVDISEHMLEIAKRKAKENRFRIDTFKSDVQKIDLEDKTFDIIVSKNTIHELEKPELFMKETYRLLKPNGISFLIDFNGDYPDWKLRPLWLLIRITGGKRAAKGFWHSHKAGFKINEIVKMCQEVGYGSVNAEPYGAAYYIVAKK